MSERITNITLEIILLLDALNITQAQAATFLEVEGRTVRRWVGGETPVPAATIKLLRLMVRMGLSPYEIEYWTAKATGESAWGNVQ